MATAHAGTTLQAERAAVLGVLSQRPSSLPSRRAPGKQAPGSHRKAFFPENPVAPELLSDKWQIAKEGRKQVHPNQ